MDNLLRQNDNRADTVTAEAFRFSATGGEYFRIWIVNLLLSIVTLGIYSAWAKVRRNKYFYSSTQLAGASFEYHGTPMAILKGRIVAFALFAVYNIAFQISIAAGVVMVLAMAAVLPWLLWKSLQFKLHNTSYRGIRFAFQGSPKQAYTNFLLLPMLAALTLWLLAPFLHQRLKAFQHNESRFGTSKFSFDASVGAFYKSYGLFIALLLGGLALLVFVVFAGVFTAAALQSGTAGAAAVLAGLAIYAWLFTVYPLFTTMIQNLIWNHTKLEQHQFKSEMKWGRLTFITLTNLLGIVCTLGLFTPFAQVRALRYRLESTSLQVHGSLDDFVADTQRQVSATGEGMVDLLDFDLSI